MTTESDTTPGSSTPIVSALTPTLIRGTVVAALGGLLFGFDTAVISGTTAALRAEYGLGDFTLGFTVASALIGTILGSLTAGVPADRFGRRPTLVGIAALYLVSAIGCAAAWDWISLVTFRFLGGLGVGGASVVAPLYIAEIAPARWRGRLVAVTQFQIVAGILLAFLSNYVIALIVDQAIAWRWMFGVEAVPALAFLLLMGFTPESPRWLVGRGRDDQALAVLIALGTPRRDAPAKLKIIRDSFQPSRDDQTTVFWSERHRTPILLAGAIAAFNQFSGINAVMYYAPDIFRMAGAGDNAALLQAVAIGGLNLVFTLAAMSVIDRLGRRKLMLIGSIGYLLSLTITAAAFFSFGSASEFTPTGSAVVLGGLLLFIASHAFGQGAVIWVFIGEIFPNTVRAYGQAWGSFVHWSMAALISWTFPMIAGVSGGYAFAFYAVMMVGQLIWVIRIMPETRGVPLEEMERLLHTSKS